MVNHGKREAVEFFELLQHGGRCSLVWRGCALPPGDPFLNDVAALRDGGFFVTHMFNKSTRVDDEGNLWIASHKHDALAQTCEAVTAGPCLLPYDVLKVDPATMEPQVVFEESGPPMGYATVALKVGDRVYMGSAHGDRVASRVIAN